MVYVPPVIRRCFRAWAPWDWSDPWSWITVALSMPVAMAWIAYFWMDAHRADVYVGLIAVSGFALAAGFHRSVRSLRRAEKRQDIQGKLRDLSIVSLALATVLLLLCIGSILVL